MRRRHLAIVGVCIALCSACASDNGTSEDPVRTPRQTAPTASPEDETRTIRVEVRAGEVVGGQRRVRVDVGDDILLVVSSDVADEVHVHGYDERADVEAGGEVRMRFTAEAPGLFVVELEERKVHLVELEVR